VRHYPSSGSVSGPWRLGNAAGNRGPRRALRPQDRANVLAVVEAMGERLDRVLIQREAQTLEIDLPDSLRLSLSG
jgi:hypothetical protein